MNIVGSSTSSHQPWNKDKLVGQKAPLRLRDIWAIRVRLQLRTAVRVSPCSTLPSTASYGHAIWSNYACAMWRMVSAFHTGRLSCTRRLTVRCSSRSPSRLVLRSAPGSPRRRCHRTPTCSQAGCVNRRICQRGNTRASSTNGSLRLAWMSQRTARTRWGCRRRRCFVAARRIFAQCSCCLELPSWRVLFVILTTN